MENPALSMQQRSLCAPVARREGKLLELGGEINKKKVFAHLKADLIFGNS